MSLPVKLLARAQADLRQIHAYVAADSPENARRFLAALRDTIFKLGDFPFAAPVPRDERLKKKGYRFVPHGEYLVFYKVNRNSVTVYRVLHGKRRYATIL